MRKGAVGAGQALRAEGQLGAVFRLQRQVPKRERIETLLDQLGDAKEVARRFGHPRAGQKKQASVHPVVDDAMAGHSLRLRELGLVMREDVVGAAGMDVESLAE